MPPTDRGRAPNGRSSIYYSETDGAWHGWVTMGTRPDGKTDRRHRKAKTEAEVTAKVRALENDREAGNRTTPGRGMLVSEWLDQWLTHIAPRRVSEHTLHSTYRPKVRRMKEMVGSHRLRGLAPEHLDAMYTAMAKPPHSLSANSIVQHHRILARSLKVAEQRKHIPRSPAAQVDAPQAEYVEIAPLDQQAAMRVLKVCQRRRLGARWSVALALGLRQGEALGLTWDRLYTVCSECEYSGGLDTPDANACPVCSARSWRHEAEAGWQIQRRPVRHGCDDVAVCTAEHHRVPCPRGCPGHHRPTCSDECRVKSHQCPEVKRPCRPDCEEHADRCSARVEGGFEIVRRKGARPEKGSRVALPGPLVEELRSHRAKQAAEKLRAGEMWQDWGLVFARPDGQPLNKKTDYEDWHRLLAEAGVPRARVHDARHTAATLLIAQGVDIRTVQQILGHSSLAMTQRYTHVTQRMGEDAAARMGAALWR